MAMERANDSPTLTLEQVRSFEERGYVQVDGLLGEAEVAEYLEVYDRFLRGEIDAGRQRVDLGGHLGRKQAGVENITQIMRPSDLVQGLAESPLHRRALAIAERLLEVELGLDFDMLIDKAPYTRTETPWHQDAAYWLDGALELPDGRGVSCWVALDQATVENGCMWFVPGSYRFEIWPHHRAGGDSGPIEIDGDVEGLECVPVPLGPGSCTFHGERTLHYSRGNETAGHRRAFITNYRPLETIRFERAHGFDHRY